MGLYRQCYLQQVQEQALAVWLWLHRYHLRQGHQRAPVVFNRLLVCHPAFSITAVSTTTRIAALPALIVTPIAFTIFATIVAAPIAAAAIETTAITTAALASASLTSASALSTAITATTITIFTATSVATYALAAAAFPTMLRRKYVRAPRRALVRDHARRGSADRCGRLRKAILCDGCRQVRLSHATQRTCVRDGGHVRMQKLGHMVRGGSMAGICSVGRC
mmetsp:Transcript_17408/g.39801  ORF Transcript_17408/g.39801 Transcript_17408/m.39801 type:complete len:222 (+) Transcript_17408:869-1534(+)